MEGSHATDGEPEVSSVVSEKEKTEICEKRFWADPLVVWMTHCLEQEEIKSPRSKANPITYLALCNAVLLNNLISYIDTRPGRPGLCHYVRDVGTRLRNLATLLSNIQNFYFEILNQLIVMPLPDLLKIARHPDPDGSGEEMRKVMLLILGCAVQSERKEQFVDGIKHLDVAIQHAIVQHIQKVTSDPSVVLSCQAVDLDVEDEGMVAVLQRVVRERDTFAANVVELAQEHDSSDSASSGSNGEFSGHKLPESQQHASASDSSTLHSPTERAHLGVELADAKAKLRRTKQELEEKLELLSDYKEELGEKDALLAKLRQENLELLKDARTAKSYRDEADILREKASKVERLETECERYKEKLSELDFYKSRVEELRSENHVLLETRHLLEDQVDSARRRQEQNATAETQLLGVQKTVQQLQEELKTERELVAELMEQNAVLEQEHRNVLSKSNLLEHQLEDMKMSDDGEVAGVSISDQISDSVHSRLLQLELENKSLMSANSDSLTAKDVKIAELQSEVERLNKKMEFVQEQNMRGSTMCLDLQDGNVELLRQKASLETELASLAAENKRTVERLTLERSRLNEEMNEIRESLIPLNLPPGLDLRGSVSHLTGQLEELNTKAADLARDLAQIRDVDKPKLGEELKSAKSRLADVEREKLDLQSKSHVVERDLKYMEKENANLKQLLEVADADFEKHRSQISSLERENQRLSLQAKNLEEMSSKLADVQVEKKHAAQQLDFEAKKGTALREDLIKEKTKCQVLLNQIEIILTAVGISTPPFLPSPSAPDGGVRVPPIDAEVTSKLNAMRAEHRQAMEGVETRLQQAERERDSVKEALEAYKMRVAQDQKREGNNKKSSPDQLAQIEIRNQLDSLEHENRQLISENRSVKEQVYLLQEQLRRNQTQTQSLAAENAGYKQELAELRAHANSVSSMRTENAQLQVDLRHLQLQLNVLEADNIELQKQNAMLETEFGKLSRNYEHLQRLNADLSGDHELLQNHHLTLNRDHERVCSELTDFKTTVKQLRLDYHSQAEQFDILARENDQMKRGFGRLKSEKESWERDFRSLAHLQSDHGALKRAHEDLRSRMEHAQERLRALQAENNALKSELNGVGYRSAQVQGQISDLQDRVHEKELEIVKLEHKCEMFHQLGATLEDENRTLLRQMDMVVTQNKDLFHQALSDKDHFHNEEKELQEKLNKIRRQKEKLEEKIMEQYKTMSPAKGKRSTSLMKRAKALLTRSDSRRNATSRYTSSTGGPLIHNESMELAVSADESCASLPRAGSLGFFTLRRTASTDDLRCDGKDPPLMQADELAGPMSDSEILDKPNTSDESMGSVERADHEQDRISLTGSERPVDVPDDPCRTSLGSEPSPARYAGALRSGSPPPAPVVQSGSDGSFDSQESAAALQASAPAPGQSGARLPPPYKLPATAGAPHHTHHHVSPHRGPYSPPHVGAGGPFHPGAHAGSPPVGGPGVLLHPTGGHAGSPPIGPGGYHSFVHTGSPPVGPQSRRPSLPGHLMGSNAGPGPPIVVTFASSSAVPTTYRPRIPLKRGQVLAKAVRNPSCPARISIHKPILPPYPGAGHGILRPLPAGGGQRSRHDQRSPHRGPPVPVGSSTPKMGASGPPCGRPPTGHPHRHLDSYSDSKKQMPRDFPVDPPTTLASGHEKSWQIVGEPYPGRCGEQMLQNVVVQRRAESPVNDFRRRNSSNSTTDANQNETVNQPPPKSRAGATNSEARVSYYENVHEGDAPHAPSTVIPEPTTVSRRATESPGCTVTQLNEAGQTVVPPPVNEAEDVGPTYDKEKRDDLWFEYGCV